MCRRTQAVGSGTLGIEFPNTPALLLVSAVPPTSCRCLAHPFGFGGFGVAGLRFGFGFLGLGFFGLGFWGRGRGFGLGIVSGWGMGFGVGLGVWVLGWGCGSSEGQKCVWVCAIVGLHNSLHILYTISTQFCDSATAQIYTPITVLHESVTCACVLPRPRAAAGARAAGGGGEREA